MRLEVVDEASYQGVRIWHVSQVDKKRADGYVTEGWMPFKVWLYPENARRVVDLINSRGVATYSDLVENSSLHGWRRRIRDGQPSMIRVTKSKAVELKSPGRPRHRFSRAERDREIYQLLPKAKSGDPTAIGRITELYLSVVREVVKQTVSFQPTTSSLVGYEDLMQDGLEGLLLAIKVFDPSNGWGFEQHCRIKIKYWILDQIDDRAYSIWLPRTILRARRALERARRQLGSQGNHNPSLEELARQAGFGLVRAKIALEAPLVQVSLNQPVGLEEKARELGEIWQEQAAYDPRNDPEETDSFVEVETPRLQEAVGKLSERERLVLSLRFFTNPPWSQSKVAEVLRVSYSRVSQIETSALAKLRKELGHPSLDHPSPKEVDSQELSVREAEVAKFLQEGLSNQEIADRLGIAHETVKTFVQKIYRKTGTTSRREFLKQGRDLPQGDELRNILEFLDLRRREIDVAEMLFDGKATREIGRELFLSPSTINVYIKRIYRKLGGRKQLFDLVEEEYRRRTSTAAG